MLAIAVGLVKGLGEPVGDQQGEVGIFRTEGGVGVGVAVHRVDALHILGHHVAVWIHAEGAHAVAVLLGAVDQLGLVDHIGDVLKDGGGQLHPDADVHLVVQQLQPQGLALVGEPLRPGPSRRGDEVFAPHLAPLGQEEPVAVLRLLNGGYLRMEGKLQLVRQPLIDVGEDAQIVLSAQVLAPGLKEVEIVGQGLAGQLPGRLALGGEYLGGGPVGHIDGVHIVDELHHMGGLHKVGKPAAELGGEVEFPVGESPGPAEAAHGMAHGTADALLHLPRHDGAAAAVDVRPLVQGQHLQLGMEMGQLIGGENACLPTAQDHSVVIGVH